MAVKRAKKLKKEEFNNVKIIEKRLELIKTDIIEIANLKIELSKKINTVINSQYKQDLLEEIGKIELYIDKKKAALSQFTKETNEQNAALAKDLQSKYGDGTINPSKGTFIPTSL
jgi:hypothetical protein